MAQSVSVRALSVGVLWGLAVVVHGTDCPPGAVEVGRVSTGAVCEDFGALNGSMTFPGGAVLRKRVYVGCSCHPLSRVSTELTRP
jgi:hypothetical protein